MPARASVIVPVFNGQRFIVEQLDALLRQTILPDLEIIVVDDRSRDATPRVVDDWIRANDACSFKLVRRTRRGGPNAARNVGLSLATSETILFCDGDDVVDEGWAAAMVDACSPGAIVSGRYLRFGGDPTTSGDWVYENRTLFRWEYALGGSLGVARSLAIGIGGFDESIKLGGTEVEFCIRAQLSASARIIRVENAIVHHRAPAHATSTISRAFRRERGHAIIRRRYRDAGQPHDWQSYLRRVRGCAADFVLGRKAVFPGGRSAALGRFTGVVFWPLYAQVRAPRPQLMSPEVGTGSISCA